ncbi:MAG: type II secretion system F family protein [archaeon]
MNFEKKHLWGVGIGIVIVVLSFLFFYGENLFYFLLVIAIVVSTIPFILSLVSGQSKEKEKEEKFLAFARDLVENVKSGTPIVKSIIILKRRDYGALSYHVNKLSNQLFLGITLGDALTTFAKETNSKVISRSVGLISSAERAGGKIDTILESVANSVNQIETLRKERKSSISNLVTQGYIIFMIFIVIMLVLEFKILPLVYDLSSVENLSIQAGQLDPNEFSMPLFLMLLVQSFFAGLVIGKISEGSIKRGIRHSFILLVLTLLITTGAKALFA